MVEHLESSNDSTTEQVIFDMHDSASKAMSWVAIWTAAPQLTESANLPPPPFISSGPTFRNSTIRQTLRVTSEAHFLRCRISNSYGLTSLRITSVTAALPKEDPEFQTVCGSRKIHLQSIQRITFNRQQSINVAPGCCAVSDPFTMPMGAGDILSISMYLPEGQAGNAITSHPGSRTDSWISAGDCVEDETICDLRRAFTNVKHWYFLSAVEALKAPGFGTFTIFGDSISDGKFSTDNGNNRWSDLLFDRIQAHPRLQGRIALVNQSLGGNRVLTDGVGPSAWSRIDRDVLSLQNLKGVLLFTGVNDIGTSAPSDAELTVEGLVEAFQQMATMVRARGALVFIATIPAFLAPPEAESSYSTPVRLQVRQQVNQWIRTSDHFDEVIDVAKILASQTDSDRIATKYNSGDFLHPNILGFQAIANGFPLDRLISMI